MQPKEMALQQRNPDYEAACFHVFLRIQLWKKAIISISWQEEHSLEVVMPGEFHSAQGAFVQITPTAGVSPRRTSRKEIHHSYFNILSIRYPSLQRKKNQLKIVICISICQRVKEATGCDRTWLVTRATSPYTLHWISGGGLPWAFEPQNCATPNPIALTGASSPPLPDVDMQSIQFTPSRLWVMVGLGGSWGPERPPGSTSTCCSHCVLEGYQSTSPSSY